MRRPISIRKNGGGDFVIRLPDRSSAPPLGVAESVVRGVLDDRRALASAPARTNCGVWQTP
jgi:hypothetical protein